MNGALRWFSGPPPHIGWWEASVANSPDVWRWWNGEAWSWPVNAHHKLSVIGRIASMREPIWLEIEWTERWPENARVPRVNPNAPG